jgi:hypothetical protein
MAVYTGGAYIRYSELKNELPSSENILAILTDTD